MRDVGLHRGPIRLMPGLPGPVSDATHAPPVPQLLMTLDLRISGNKSSDLRCYMYVPYLMRNKTSEAVPVITGRVFRANSLSTKVHFSVRFSVLSSQLYDDLSSD
jgi:hypothetical protein